MISQFKSEGTLSSIFYDISFNTGTMSNHNFPMTLASFSTCCKKDLSKQINILKKFKNSTLLANLEKIPKKHLPINSIALRKKWKLPSKVDK
jgi:hypothetical protein